MVSHVVLFTLKDPADVAQTVKVLRGMEGRIPTLASVEVGVDELPGPRSSHICLITRFQDMAGLEAYRVHPVHQVVLQHMHRVASSATKVDWTA